MSLWGTPSFLLEATLAAASIKQQNLRLNCQQSSCIMGNVGGKF